MKEPKYIYRVYFSNRPGQGYTGPVECGSYEDALERALEGLTGSFSSKYAKIVRYVLDDDGGWFGSESYG